MIKIDKTEVFGWESAIRGMRNPMNSWDKSDSWPFVHKDIHTNEHLGRGFHIGENDLKLMKSLSKAGPDHGKFLRMINVTCDINAPLYWWKEFDTYKIGTVANSCSTMHKIHVKEFTLDDFSCEHLFGNFLVNKPESEVDTDCYVEDEFGEPVLPFDLLRYTIRLLNKARERFLEAKTKPMKEESRRSGLMKKYWWQMIQLLPSSYNQKRTVQLNYQVLKNMYNARKSHKLDEWRALCAWCETLPYFKEICLGGNEDGK